MEALTWDTQGDSGRSKGFQKRTLNGEVLAGAPINPGLGTARERGACNQAEKQDKPKRFRILKKGDF